MRGGARRRSARFSDQPGRPRKQRDHARLRRSPDLKKALKTDKAAQAAWDRYSYTCRKELVQWITDAKKPETRVRRLEKAIEMLAAGRNLSQR